MDNALVELLKQSVKYKEFLNNVKENILENKLKYKEPFMLSGLTDVSKKQIISALFKDIKDSNIYYIVENQKRAEEVYKDFEFFENNISILKEKDIHNFLVISENKNNLFERMKVLSNIVSNEKNIIVTTIESFMQLIINKELIKKHTLNVKVNNEIIQNEIINKLNLFGYTRLTVADTIFSYSIKGGIIDIAFSDEMGYRIELWGDLVESIRIYDLATQKSIKQIEKINITPATEYILTDSIENIVNNIKEKNKINLTNNSINEEISKDLEEIENGNYFEFVEKYITSFYKENELTTLISYLNNKDIIVIDDKLKVSQMANGLIKTYSISNKNLLDKNKLQIESLNCLITYDEFIKNIEKKNLQCVYLNDRNERFLDISSLKAVKNQYEFSYKESTFFRSEVDSLLEKLEKRQLNETIILLAGGNLAEVYNFLNEKIENTKLKISLNKLNKDNYLLPGVYVQSGTLSNGFKDLENNLEVIYIGNLKEKVVRRKNLNAYNKAEKIVFADLQPNDYIVHKANGIGKFIAIESVEALGVTKDYIKLEYSGGDFLYIPTDDLSNVRKYIGSDSDNPKLNKLGTSNWESTKQRVKKNLRELAKELIKLYAIREKVKGYSFSKDTELQAEFENSFKYIETNDQLRCVEEIKSDMESTKPMDRLLCGDVGFGKTEVAMRAAFKAINDSKQVAYIVPTTVLAFQQYNSFKSRMEDFPVNIDHISRFKTTKEQKETIFKLKHGEIDIIIGTHRLLSSDIEFKDLGLLIIDEEHRFGVKAKEKIKELKNSIDVLTMSATPIPRTMHMSLSGTRDMSVIYDPPIDRKPVTTYIIEEDMDVIKIAINKELERNGQVFYIHNTVNDIERTVQNLSELVPNANFDYAHGKMSASQIEKKMEDFVDHKTDVLVCTSILESGIDIPNANTIIIENADKLGLAQLYQMRGRVRKK